MSNDFKISPDSAKFENELCRCCHSEGKNKSLYTKYYWLDVEEVMYASIIQECFNIELHEMRDQLRNLLGTICYACIKRLEDAVKFKRQIQKCEEQFLEIFAGYIIKDPSDEEPLSLPIKQEIIDILSTDEEMFEPDNFDLAMKEDAPGDDISERDAAAVDEPCDDEICDDDVKPGDEFCDDDVKPDGEEIIFNHVVKSMKTTKKGKKSKTTRNKKKLKTPKITDPAENGVDSVAGVVKVAKRVFVKRNVDFKKVDENFQCQKCPHKTKSLLSMKNHIRIVHLNVSRFKCHICSELFATATKLTKHKLQKHDLDDRFRCNACDGVYNTKVQLKRHINSFHMLGVKIKCQECDYETFGMESLNKHKYKHKTVKDYQCKYCKKAFVRKTTLQLHERIHTGDRRKVCAVCGQAFVQKASLNYHMTKYHPEVVY